MKYVFCLLVSSLCATEAITEAILEEKPQKNYMPYCSIGGAGLIIPICPEISIGCRKLNSHHSWDVNAGANMATTCFAQASYLYYPQPSKESYMGIGLTGGFIINPGPGGFVPIPRYYVNVPVTVGYQWEKSFLQMQVTPLCTMTVSYGIGF